VTGAAATERGARERILAAAVDRIARHGIDEVRIARIAMDAGVSSSLVHYHFETREALLEQALDYSYELAGDVRLGPEGDVEELGSVKRLAAMIDQCLPYPGMLERDWILWVELWLRAARHPEMRPTAARLYARMRGWFAEAIATGVERGEFASDAEPERIAELLLALADGYGVRVLFGDFDVAHARREIWAAVQDELALPDQPPPPLDPAKPQD
jgi:AcrR family transcriptional regulator